MLITLQLTALYRTLAGDSHASWIDLGIGIRVAQDVGAHRKNSKPSRDPVEAEQWKRTFWCFVTLDRLVSSGLGQSLTVHEEEYGSASYFGLHEQAS